MLNYRRVVDPFLSPQPSDSVQPGPVLAVRKSVTPPELALMGTVELKGGAPEHGAQKNLEVVPSSGLKIPYRKHFKWKL